MLISKKVFLFFLCFVIICSNVKAQSSALGELLRQQRREEQEEINRQKREREVNERIRATDRLANGPREVHVRNIPVTKPLTREEREKIRAIMTPNTEDLAKYKDFLKQKNTGLFRLFPDVGCQTKNVIRVDGDCANFIPESWAYSFRKKNYSDADYLDIRFRSGHLITNGFLSQGILVQLGDIPLEAVSLASSGMKFLFQLEPQVQIKEAKKQFLQIGRGIEADGYKYSKAIKAEENTTYALRVIAYRTEDTFNNQFLANSAQESSKFINLNYDDKRIDLTVAFRILRRDNDGNITILWKELERQKAPKIVFPKNEKLSDIMPDK